MLSELAAVVPGERVDAPTDRLERMQDRSHRRLGCTAGHTAQAHQTGFAFDQCDDTSGSLADDGVASPIADALPAINKRRALRDTAPAEALLLPWRAAAVLTSVLAASQLRPQRSARFVVCADVLIDRPMADQRSLAPDDLLGTQVLSQCRTHDRLDCLIEARLRTHRVSALRTLTLCFPGFTGPPCALRWTSRRIVLGER